MANKAGFLELARLSLLAALLLFNYGVVRSAIDSSFLEGVGKQGLPWAWLMVAAGAIAVTTAFDKAARRLSLPRLFVMFAAGVTLCLALFFAWWRATQSAASLYALYVWKDVHIVVLLEILWGRANSTYPKKTARWAYGLFCAAGSVGGIGGGSFASLWAEELGTDAMLEISIGCLTFTTLVGGLVFRSVRGPLREVKKDSSTPMKNGLAVLRSSKMLPFLLAMVLLSQLTITLIDYLFNGYMQETFADLDERTAMMGMVYASIDGSALVLQLLSGLLLVSIGVRRALLLVPFLLGVGVTTSALTPVFFWMAGVKVASKAMDYSVFRAAKEILYIPLTYPEKSQGKGLVDVVGYRSAKAGAAAVVLLLTGMSAMVWAATLGAIGLWLVVAFFAGRRHHAQSEAQSSAKLV